jgi:hypothetical protein
MSEGKTFSCKQCGHAFTAYPPDNSFKEAFMNRCQEESDEDNHNFETRHRCEDCKFEDNILYWCQGHSHFEGIEKRSFKKTLDSFH